MVEALWCMAATPFPKGTTVEQVVGTVQGVLGAVSGLDLGQIWTWAQYKVCYVDNALQL
jgi:hypothetical protein